ncbi:hypothetical protein TNIN_499611 [Trichonephila inaurata madagascariensis]|uniref:Uncharacterized protein n=1 Tax=Trichonephila inaurata madagascariensis TaxID=2747483 RepID=A0A8X6XWS9_9ARAC|nr:hypothetical protein TNIN_499611 [Trichonephila inaurata madagascariensis]
MLGDGEWNEDDFDWQKRAAKANRDLYLDIFVEIDFKNDLIDNKYYVMYFETGYFPFENPEDHDFLNENKTQNAVDYIIEVARAMGSELEDDKLQQQAQEILEIDFLLYNVWE